MYLDRNRLRQQQNDACTTVCLTTAPSSNPGLRARHPQKKRPRAAFSISSTPSGQSVTAPVERHPPIATSCLNTNNVSFRVRKMNIDSKTHAITWSQVYQPSIKCHINPPFLRVRYQVKNAEKSRKHFVRRAGARQAEGL